MTGTLFLSRSVDPTLSPPPSPHFLSLLVCLRELLVFPSVANMNKLEYKPFRPKLSLKLNRLTKIPRLLGSPVPLTNMSVGTMCSPQKTHSHSSDSTAHSDCCSSPHFNGLSSQFQTGSKPVLQRPGSSPLTRSKASSQTKIRLRPKTSQDESAYQQIDSSSESCGENSSTATTSSCSLSSQSFAKQYQNITNRLSDLEESELPSSPRLTRSLKNSLPSSSASNKKESKVEAADQKKEPEIRKRKRFNLGRKKDKAFKSDSSQGYANGASVGDINHCEKGRESTLRSHKKAKINKASPKGIEVVGKRKNVSIASLSQEEKKTVPELKRRKLLNDSDLDQGDEEEEEHKKEGQREQHEEEGQREEHKEEGQREEHKEEGQREEHKEEEQRKEHKEEEQEEEHKEEGQEEEHKEEGQKKEYKGEEHKEVGQRNEKEEGQRKENNEEVQRKEHKEEEQEEEHKEEGQEKEHRDDETEIEFDSKPGCGQESCSNQNTNSIAGNEMDIGQDTGVDRIITNFESRKPIANDDDIGKKKSIIKQVIDRDGASSSGQDKGSTVKAAAIKKSLDSSSKKKLIIVTGHKKKQQLKVKKNPKEAGTKSPGDFKVPQAKTQRPDVNRRQSKPTRLHDE